MIEITSEGVPIKAWVEGVQLEEAAIQQLRNTAKLPIIGSHIAVMPDSHFGKGSTVGSVIPTVGAIIPAAVGGDGGCGMVALKTKLRASDLPDSLANMRSAIESVVPHGRTNNGGVGDKGAWPVAPNDVDLEWRLMTDKYAEIISKNPKAQPLNKDAGWQQLGTLGGGNHFVEICLDTEQQVWIMLHSGSRGVGNRIGSYFTEVAKLDMEAAHGYMPEDVDLCYLTEGTQHFADYVEAVGWVQDYARVNRSIMLRNVIRAVWANCRFTTPLFWEDFALDTAVNCHHNYVAKEHHFGQDVWLTRKGAVDASVGKLGIIPGSMGAKSFIVRGRGNAESFNSCSHGAGRSMSRNAAKKQYSIEDMKAATLGIECRKDEDVIDEIPYAYKSIDDVMWAQRDLVEVVATLKQVLCVKG